MAGLAFRLVFNWCCYTQNSVLLRAERYCSWTILIRSVALYAASPLRIELQSNVTLRTIRLNDITLIYQLDADDLAHACSIFNGKIYHLTIMNCHGML